MPSYGYPIRDGQSVRPPSHDRVARGLSDADLEEEILGRRGEADYQLALVREADRRAKTLPERGES